MIHSKYIHDILTQLLSEDKYLLIKKQIDYIEEKNYDYTASGVFVNFKHQEEVMNYKFPAEHLRLNGVLIKSDEIDIAAEAAVVIKEGLIDYLEIWSYGDTYPQEDPKQYTLEQQW